MIMLFCMQPCMGCCRLHCGDFTEQPCALLPQPEFRPNYADKGKLNFPGGPDVPIPEKRTKWSRQPKVKGKPFDPNQKRYKKKTTAQ